MGPTKPDPTVAARLSRERVIDAAIAIAEAEGMEAATLTRVASELGVSQPALYRHIGGLDGLRRALTLRAREMFVDHLVNAAIGRSGEDAMRSLATAWRGGARGHRGLLSLSTVTSTGDPELEASIDRIVEVITRTLSSLDLDDEERVHAARSLRSALHGFSVLEVNYGNPRSVDIEESFEQLVNFVWNGLRAMEHAPMLDDARSQRRENT